MISRNKSSVQPVNFHADPEIHDKFVEKLTPRHKTKREGLNEAMFMWTYLAEDPQTLQRLKELVKVKGAKR